MSVGEPPRALVVSAHPDDIEFGCAGTICRWVEEGWDVRYVIVTSGQRGVQDAAQDPEDFGRLREAEAAEAARICGVREVSFLRWMDSELLWADGRELRRQLSRQFRLARPHRLVTMDPQILPTDYFVNHPDHRTVGTATLDMTMTGGTTAAIFPELLSQEGLEPWKGLEEAWIMGPAGGSTVIDISATMERKLEALGAHRSQVGDWDAGGFMRRRLRALGELHGYAYAEAFRVIRYRR